MASRELPPTIVECALAVLHEADPDAKVRLTNAVAEAWRAGGISCEPPERPTTVPDRPARPDDRVRLVPAWELPQRGKGGSLASRLALLHSLAHIESWAIDLSWDIIARFGRDSSYALPRAFFDDFVAVAEDEARHYALLCARLREEGSHYGALPAHDGLWESATATRESLPARLAVEHCAHEARGLDVLPQTIARFRRAGDERSAALMSDVIYPEEVTHCAAGVRWIRWLHARARGGAVDGGEAGGEAGSGGAGSGEAGSGGAGSGEAGIGGAGSGEAGSGEAGSGEAGTGEASTSPSSSSPRAAAWAEQARRHETPATWFHELIRAHFRGPLKPPFNDEARAQAGFSTEWYLPLATVGKQAAT